ncbi:hypothetical protein LXL04_037411 [Taraxacum kok-saghyz]
MVDLAIPAGRHHSSTRARESARTMCRNGRLEDQATNMDSLSETREGSLPFFSFKKACGSLPMPSSILPVGVPARCAGDSFIRRMVSFRKTERSKISFRKDGLNVKSGTRPVFSVKVLIVSNAVLNDEYAARVSATVPHSSSFRSPLLSVNSPLQISFTASVPQQDPQKMKMPLKQQQKQATEMPSPKIASNFPNPEIPKLYDPTQSHETTQPEREQKNFPRLPFGLQQQKVAMDPTQNSNRKTEMPSVDHSVQTFGFPPLEDREKSVSIKTILPLGRIGKFVKRESIKLQHEPNLQHEPYAQFTEEEKKRREIRAKIMLLNFKVLNPFIQRQLTVDVELSRRI